MISAWHLAWIIPLSMLAGVLSLALAWALWMWSVWGKSD